jgi:hypothetical protein
MKKILNQLFTLAPVLVLSGIALADAGDIGSALKDASGNIKEWGTDAMLAVTLANVGLALILKYYCPRWLERVRDHAWQSVGVTFGLYLIFFWFGNSIRDAFKQHLNFWQWFGL